MGELGAVQLKMVEFSEDLYEWSMKIPESTEDSFISLSDDSFNFTLRHSSLEEVKTSFKQLENGEISEIFNSAILSAKNVSSKYKNIIEKTLNKLVSK